MTHTIKCHFIFTFCKCNDHPRAHQTVEMVGAKWQGRRWWANAVGCSLFRPNTLAPVGPPMCSGPPGLSQICKLAPYPPPTPHNNDPLQVWSGFFLMPRRCPILKTIQKSGGANAWRKKFLSLFLKVLQNS